MTALVHIYGESHVAATYGLEEAIFLHSLMFWYRTNRGNDANFRDGRWWTYNSVKAFEAVFPWWNAGQIRRIITRCREKGALLSGDYNEDRRDRTAWYTPSDDLLEMYGELGNTNCICRKRQMQLPDQSSSSDENGKCNIRKPWGNHGETDSSPYSPPAGDAPSEPVPVDKPRREKSMPTHNPEAFEVFWAAYPRKDDRKKAIRAWDRLKPNKALCRVMYAALLRQKESAQWTRDGGQYIPMFPTWINGRRWEDQGVDPSQLPRPQNSGGWADDPEVCT